MPTMPTVRNVNSSSVSKPGAFIISLDFELHWGVFDHLDLTDQSRAYFDRTRALIPTTLDLFTEYSIRATWATVGMLFARDKEELTTFLPPRQPTYTDARLNPYRLLPTLGANETADPYHYAPSLIDRIAGTAGQSIGSHTFGHYYCLEEGQTLTSFADDLGAAQGLARQRGYAEVHSLVFPRNQYRADYFGALTKQGFTTYRTNPRSWFWRTRSGTDTSVLQRAVRLADNYMPLSSTTSFTSVGPTHRLYDVPASRFFRPYVKYIDGYGGQELKIRRILREMRQAARSRRHYHLWWHPHNLATDPARNMAGLARILNHYHQLNQRYGWESHSMESYVRTVVSPQPLVAR